MKPTSVASGALLAAFGGTALYLLWVSLPWPLIHDAPIMHYIAWRIAHGAVPYRDLFDMNQPGAYLVHLAVIRVFGEGDVGWRVFDLTALALGAAAIARYAAPWGVVASVGGALSFVLYHLADGAWQAGQRDFLLCPLLVIAAGGVAAWVEDLSGGASATLMLALSGLALGAAITIKPHTALFALMLLVVVAIVAARRHDLTSSVTIYLAPLLLPPVVVLAWLAKLGALGAWREIVFDYLVPLYSKLGRGEWAFYRWSVWIPIALTAALSIASAASHHRFTTRHGIAVLGLVYGLVHFFRQGKGWEYHLYPLAAFAMLLLFSELDIVLRDRRFAAAIPLVAALVVTLVMLGQKGVEAASAEWIWDKERVVRWITRDIGPQLKPDDTVQVFDTTEGGIHALLRLHTIQPTRFLYDFHFFHDTDQPLIQRLRRELVTDLAARPPRFVVILERGWPSGRLDRIQSFPELTRWLEGSYVLFQHRGGYVIFEKRRGS